MPMWSRNTQSKITLLQLSLILPANKWIVSRATMNPMIFENKIEHALTAIPK